MGIKIIRIKPNNRSFIIPSKITDGSAAYDAFIPNDTPIYYGRQVIPLGFAVSFDSDIKLDCRTRAGYAAKGILVVDERGNDVRLDADVTLGLIDSDYRGTVGVIINCRDIRAFYRRFYYRQFNSNGKPNAIAQLSFGFVPDTELVVIADKLDTTKRGSKGFGEANNE